MIVIEETTVPDAALPVDQFKAHLRLGTGFGVAGLQDQVLMGFLRAAIAAIESRTGKVLISRSYTWETSVWRDRTLQALPLVPVSAVSQIAITDASGTETIVDPGAYRLEPDSQCPRLRPVTGQLPAVPSGGGIRVGLIAGMAADWGGLPADLGQAVLMLAAHYYEYRDETALGDGCMPFGVTSLIQRYRRVRLGLGASR